MQSRIDISVLLDSSDAQRKIADLSAELKGLEVQSAGIIRRYGEAAGGTYIARETARIQGEIEQQAAALTRIQSVGGNVDYQQTINQLTGVSAGFRAAAREVEVFNTAASQRRVAAVEGVLAQRAAAATPPSPRPIPTPVSGLGKLSAQEAERLEQTKALFTGGGAGLGIGSAISSGLTAPTREARQALRTASDGVEELAVRVLNLQTVLSTVKAGSENFKIISNEIEVAKSKFSSLVEGGAIGRLSAGGRDDSDVNYGAIQSVQHQIAEDAKAAFYANEQLAQSAARHLALERAIRETLTQSNAARLTAVQTVALSAKFDVSRSEVSGAEAAAIGLAGAMGRVGRGAKAAAKEVEDSGNVSGRVLKGLVSVADETARGQRGAIFSSVSSMVRDVGLLHTAIGALSGPWGAVAAAGIAALAALGYEAEQTYQRLKSIRDTTQNLGLQGFGTTESQTAGQFDTIKADYKEFAGTTRELQAELTKLPAAAQSSWRGFISLAEAFSRIKNISPVKALEEIVKEAQKGPVEFAKWIEVQTGLEGKLDASGKSLHELAGELVNTSEAFAKVTGAANSVPMVQIGDDARKASNDWLALAGAATRAADALGMVSETDLSTLNKAFGTLTAPTFRLPQNLVDQNKLIESGNKALRDREREENQIKSLQGRVDAERAGEGGGDPQRIKDLTHEIEILKESLEKLHDPIVARGFELGGIASEEQMRQATANIQQQIMVQRDTIKSAREFYGQGQSDQVAVSRIPQVAQEENKLLDLQRQEAKQAVEVEIQKQRNLSVEQTRGTQERLRAAQRAADLTQTRYPAELGGEPMFNPVQQEQAQHQVSTDIQQINADLVQSARARARAEIDAAQGSADKIIAIYQGLFAEVSAHGAKPAVLAQLGEEEVKDLRSAQAKAFSATSEYNNALEKLDSIRIKSFQLGLQSQVASHQISKAQMAGFETQESAQVLAGEEQRTAAIINSGALTDAQKERMYEHLSELYSKDAEAQVKAQEDATKAIEAENAKRIKSFTNMFDAVGSGFEKFITAGITKSETRPQALKQLGQSLVSAAVGEAGGLASKFAGEAVGPKLGLTDEQSSGGLGQVLGNAVAKSLGLLKETPADKNAAVSERLGKAADAELEAAKLQKDSFGNLQKAAEALQRVADKLGGGQASVASASPMLGPWASGTDVKAAQMSADLSKLGYTPTASAAIVGNSIQESSLRSNAIGKAGELGLFQELGPRRTGLEAYATSTGRAATDPHAQIEYMDKELTKLDPTFKTSNAPISELAPRFEKVFEKPKSLADAPVRTANAEKVLTEQQSSIASQLPQAATSSTPVKVDPTSVAQGVTQGQQQGAAQQTASIQAANVPLVSAQTSAKASIDASKAADDKNTSAVEQNTQKQQSASTGSSSGASSGVSSGLGLLTQGLGIASGAAAAFGRSLSPTTRAVLGTVGVMTQLMSFGKTLSSTFDLAGTATKTATLAQTALTPAILTQTTANAAETLSTQTLSAAQSAAAASSGGGVFGGLFKLFGFASGTTSTPAGGIVVGEQGPELLFQPGGLGVLNAGMTRNLLGGSGRVNPSDISLPGLARPTFTSTNNTTNPTTNMTYAPQIGGRYGSLSRTEMSSLIRSHGDSFMGMARNAIRNGALGYR